VQHHAHSLPVNTCFTCQSSLLGDARLAASTSAHTQKACMLPLSFSYTQPATSLSKHTIPISHTCPRTIYLSASPVQAHFTCQSHLSMHTLHISHTCKCTLHTSHTCQSVHINQYFCGTKPAIYLCSTLHISWYFCMTTASHSMHTLQSQQHI